MSEIVGRQPSTATRDYHEQTKHIEARLRADPHYLDWANQPIPFKLYRSLESLPLPGDAATLTGTTTPTIVALAASTPGDARFLDLATLARVLFLGAGITKRKRYSGGEMYFRAYANTGALYHIDLYVVNGSLDGLPAGVWHFAPNDFALYRLRDGDYRAALIRASGGHARVDNAAAILVSASTWWRNAWKYRARTYRHCFWDAGTMHANLLAIAGLKGLDPRVIMGFADAEVETLLGLDVAREGAVALLPIGATREPAPPAPPIESLELETEPLSRSEVDYPAIRAMHVASSLADGGIAAAWRDNVPAAEPPVAADSPRPLAPMNADALAQKSIAQARHRFRSALDRAFGRDH
jgi:SagB-type dehydrogenase family enzyme